MANNKIVIESHAPTEEKEVKNIASESLSDLEAGSVSSMAARRPGSI
jgi:hypothetical protein